MPKNHKTLLKEALKLSRLIRDPDRPPPSAECAALVGKSVRQTQKYLRLLKEEFGMIGVQVAPARPRAVVGGTKTVGATAPLEG